MTVAEQRALVTWHGFLWHLAVFRRRLRIAGAQRVWTALGVGPSPTIAAGVASCVACQ